MDFTDNDEPAPQDLLIAFQCETWQTMPEAGGLYDQDYATMTRITACRNIYSALSHLRNASGAQIHTLSDGERKILGMLVKMGLLFNVNR